jgi:hypothetical protein
MVTIALLNDIPPSIRGGCHHRFRLESPQEPVTGCMREGYGSLTSLPSDVGNGTGTENGTLTGLAEASSTTVSAL